MLERAALGGLRASRVAGLRRLQRLIDALLVLLSMLAAGAVQPLLVGLVPGVKLPSSFGDQALVACIVGPLWVALAVVVRLDRTFEEPLPHSELLARLLKLDAAGVLGVALVQFLTQSVVNRSLVALFLAFSTAALYAQRALTGAWARYQHARGDTRARLVLVGAPSARMRDFVRDAAASALAPTILGYVAAPTDEADTPDDGAALPARLGPLEALPALLEAHPVDEVVFFAPYARPDTASAALAACEALGVPASFVVELSQLARAAPRVADLYDHCVIRYDVAPKRPEALAIKHGLDPLAAAFLLVAAAPVLVTVALAVRLTMGRPVLFTQERAGRFGRPFRMFKFRTMHRDAEARRDEVRALNEVGGPVFKARLDPRVTPLGRFLRSSSLDELPQLFNVLAGSMSLVGPRPLPTQEQAQIRGWQRRRLSMKPGITGLWQVSGRSDLGFEAWMLLDLRYVDEWSLWLDLQLLLKTIPVVLRGRGAR